MYKSGRVEYDKDFPHGYDTEYTKLSTIIVTTDMKAEFEEIKALLRLETKSTCNNRYVLKELIKTWYMWNNDTPHIPNPTPFKR